MASRLLEMDSYELSDPSNDDQLDMLNVYVLKQYGHPGNQASKTELLHQARQAYFAFQDADVSATGHLSFEVLQKVCEDKLQLIADDEDFGMSKVAKTCEGMMSLDEFLEWWLRSIGKLEVPSQKQVPGITLGTSSTLIKSSSFSSTTMDYDELRQLFLNLNDDRMNKDTIEAVRKLSSSIDLMGVNLNIPSIESDDGGGMEEDKKRKELLEWWTIYRKFFKLSVATKSLNKLDKQEISVILIAACCLSFNSGYINGCCLSAFATHGEALTIPYTHFVTVSSVTGSYTDAALAIGNNNIDSFNFNVSMIFCFMFGGVLTGILIPKREAFELGPEYGPLLFMGSIILLIACIYAYQYPQGYAYFYCASIANGLQNGLSSTYSGNLIRTTHLTGTTTDIGLIVGFILRGVYKDAWKLGVLVVLAVSYFLGALSSYYAVQEYGKLSLVANTIFFSSTGSCVVVYICYAQNVSLLQALFGLWTPPSESPRDAEIGYMGKGVVDASKKMANAIDYLVDGASNKYHSPSGKVFVPTVGDA